jgi:hypothetical protein
MSRRATRVRSRWSRLWSWWARAITTFTDPAGNLDGLGEIALGSDGVLWFASTNNDRIGRIVITGPPPAPTQPVVVAPGFTG